MSVHDQVLVTPYTPMLHALPSVQLQWIDPKLICFLLRLDVGNMLSRQVAYCHRPNAGLVPSARLWAMHLRRIDLMQRAGLIPVQLSD